MNKKLISFTYDTLPEKLKDKLSYAHEHAELCGIEEIVYKESDVIDIINYCLNCNKDGDKNFNTFIRDTVLVWFKDKFVQKEEECERLIIEGLIKYSLTIEDIKVGCIEFLKHENEKPDLQACIKVLGESSDNGVKAAEASTMIRKVLIAFANSEHCR